MKEKRVIIYVNELTLMRTPYFRSLDHRLLTSTMKFATKYNLGDPEFGCFYQAQYDAYSDILSAQLSA